MACSGAMQGTAGADGGHNPQADVDIPSTPMEDALLIEHFYSSASSQAGGSNNSSPSAGMNQSLMLNTAERALHTPADPCAIMHVMAHLSHVDSLLYLQQ